MRSIILFTKLVMTFKAVDFSPTQFQCRELSNLDLKKTQDTIWGYPLKFLLLKRDSLVKFFIKSYNFRIKVRARLNAGLRWAVKAI